MKIIALDAGGTSAKFALYDDNGQLLANKNFPTPHIMEVGIDKLREIVRLGVEYCRSYFTNSDEPFVLSVGMAAYGRDKSLAKTIKQTLQMDYKHLLIHGDMEIAYKGAFAHKQGILLIAGTGSIAYTQNLGEELRTGGFGYFLGDEGSAYWIAHRALQVFTKQVDGRMPKTKLYDFVKRTLSLQDDYDIISCSLRLSRSQLASLCISLLDLYESDCQIRCICDAAVAEMALLVQTLAKKLPDCQYPLTLALVGGVFNQDLIKDALQKKLGTKYLVERVTNTPLYGAYLYAHEYLQQLS